MSDNQAPEVNDDSRLPQTDTPYESAIEEIMTERFPEYPEQLKIGRGNRAADQYESLQKCYAEARAFIEELYDEANQRNAQKDEAEQRFAVADAERLDLQASKGQLRVELTSAKSELKSTEDELTAKEKFLVAQQQLSTLAAVLSFMTIDTCNPFRQFGNSLVAGNEVAKIRVVTTNGVNHYEIMSLDLITGKPTTRWVSLGPVSDLNRVIAQISTFMSTLRLPQSFKDNIQHKELAAFDKMKGNRLQADLGALSLSATRKESDTADEFELFDKSLDDKPGSPNLNYPFTKE